MRWLCWVLSVGAFAAVPEFRVESHPVPGGAEILTVFGHLQSGPAPGADSAEVPLVSILRDTLGDDDPANDRLRYVWILTSAQPNLLRRAAAALPFFYFRPDLGKSADRQPVPVLDLASPGRSAWSAVAGTITQVTALDSNGALVRSATRSYRANAADHRQAHLAEGLSVLAQVDRSPGEVGLSERELLDIQARLALAGQALGGLVDQERLREAYYKQRARAEETRGHNWELLRQRAERNGLYFEPFGLSASRTHALLWVARQDLADTMHRFDAKFLGIANPYIDARLKAWNGFTATVYFDESGRRAAQPAPNGSANDLIPLALYSLEYPKVPLLLADFRNTHAPKRREMMRRATNDALIGLLGISKWGNWPYLASSAAYTFVRTRHGDPIQRDTRLKAYSQTRKWLALDPALDAGLRQELLRRLETLGLNPLQEDVFQEAAIARRQYAALLRYAANPDGLRVRLEQDRNSERTALKHGWKARLGLHVANVMSLGVYRHQESHPRALSEPPDAAD